MAGCLNTPADFEKSRRPENEDSQPQLLPPSVFTGLTGVTPKPSTEALSALSKAKDDILQLRLENQRIRDAMQASESRIQHVQAQALTQPSPASVNTQHYADIINRQAAELAEIQKQAATRDATYQRQIAKLESQLEFRSLEKHHQVDVLQKELQALESQYKEEFQRLCQTQEQQQEDAEETISGLRDELHKCQIKYTTEVDELKQELDDLRLKEEQLKREQQKYIKEQGGLVRAKDEELQQLRTSLTDTQKLCKSSDAWRAEVDCLTEKLQELESEKQSLLENIDLIQVKLSAQNEILTLQENELSKGKEQNITDEHKVLLTRWREKVFALMIQQKSSDLVSKDENRKWSTKMSHFDDQLSSAQTQVQVMQHSLANKAADLDLQKNHSKMIQAELNRAQDLSQHLDKQSQADHAAVVKLAGATSEMFDNYQAIESQVSEAMKTLRTYSQRLLYAKSRMEVLQGQFARKEALLRLAHEDEGQTEQKAAESQQDKELLEQMRCELEQVSRERNQMIAQMKEDAELLDVKVKSARSEVEDQLTSLKQQVEEKNQQMELKTQRCLELSERLEVAKSQVKELEQTVEQLKTDLIRREREAQTALENQSSEDRSQFTEQLAQMEKQLNEARREHAKAVVSMRQMERRCERDKERWEEQLQSSSALHEQQTVRLKEKIKSLEKDNNLLMATLRQEGLISKLKAQRPPPVISDPEDIERDQSLSRLPQNSQEPTMSTLLQDQNEFRDPSVTELSKGLPGDLSLSTLPQDGPSPDHLPTQQIAGKNESLHSAIDDLKTLTAAVMEDDDSESDAESV